MADYACGVSSVWQVLEEAGMLVEPPNSYFYNKLPQQMGPRVVFYPDFAPSQERVISCIKGGSISQGSTLVVQGDGILIENLDLDGCLWIKSAPGATVHIQNLVVRNDGWYMTPLDGTFLEPQPVHREAAWHETTVTEETRKVTHLMISEAFNCDKAA